MVPRSMSHSLLWCLETISFTALHEVGQEINLSAQVIENFLVIRLKKLVKGLPEFSFLLTDPAIGFRLLGNPNCDFLLAFAGEKPGQGYLASVCDTVKDLCTGEPSPLIILYGLCRNSHSLTKSRKG